MKKLTLDIDKLRVESFDADAAGRGRGTVRGHDYSNTCDSIADYTCHGYGTCGIYPCKQVP
jgi:hypothetical protein